MKEKKLTTKKNKKTGYYDFYVGKKDVTGLWMDFFSELSMEEEKRCVELFFKKYPNL
jgi:hypothetical protein